MPKPKNLVVDMLLVSGVRFSGYTQAAEPAPSKHTLISKVNIKNPTQYLVGLLDPFQLFQNWQQSMREITGVN